MESSQSYRAIGRGKVIEHKKLGSNDIEVIPFDEQPHQQGALVADIEQSTATGTDARGATYSSTMSTSKAITATWKGNGDNRVTAPDVRRGEWVELFEYHDTQKVYWQAISGDHSKRRKEKVTYRFSMTDDESTDESTDENSITVDHDGDQGMTTIKVPSVDGKAPVTFQMNSKQGTACMLVGEGNFVQIEEDGDTITSQNAAGSYAILEGDNIRTNCAKEKKYTTGTTQWTNENAFGLDTDTLDVTSKSTMTYNAQADWSVTTMANANITGIAVSLTGSTNISLAAPSISLIGQSSVKFSGAAASLGSDGLTEISGGASVDVNAPVFNVDAGVVTMSPSALQTLADALKPYL